MYDQARARALVRQVQANPAQGRPALLALDQMLKLGPHPLAREAGRAGANRFVRPPDPGSINANVTTPGTPITWRLEAGAKARVLAAYGQVASASDGDMAATSFQILVKDEKSIITTGDGNAFLPYLAAFGQSRCWLPLDREVENGDVWTIFWRNEGYTAAAVTPSIVFAVLQYDAKF